MLVYFCRRTDGIDFPAIRDTLRALDTSVRPRPYERPSGPGNPRISPHQTIANCSSTHGNTAPAGEAAHSLVLELFSTLRCADGNLCSRHAHQTRRRNRNAPASLRPSFE